MNVAAGTILTKSGASAVIRGLTLAVMLLVNATLYFAVFRGATPIRVGLARPLT